MKELESLQSIFKNRLFRIPDYQRGYAWTIYKQLKDFWEDVTNLPEDKMHYTGVLTLKKIDSSVYDTWNDEQWLIKDRGIKPVHVVDGQQRLTTFIIFIQTMVELVTSLSEHKDKEADKIFLGTYSINNIKESFLVLSKPPEFIINTYLFGYETDNPSFRYLRHKIDWQLFIKNDKDKITIEHILPQNHDKKCWKAALKGIKTKDRKYFAGSLGNLLPLSRSINSSLQNDCFEDKKDTKYNDRNEKIRQGYSDGSHSEIEVAQYKEWNTETIKERGLQLLKFMEKRWDLQFEDESAMLEFLHLETFY